MGCYLLLFPNPEQRPFGQWLSVAAGAIIMLVFDGLLSKQVAAGPAEPAGRNPPKKHRIVQL